MHPGISMNTIRDENNAVKVITVDKMHYIDSIPENVLR